MCMRTLQVGGPINGWEEKADLTRV
jgi:hypothetical protein